MDVLHVHQERRDWGYVDYPAFSALGHPEWGHYELAIYPPGTSAPERSLLTLHHDWTRCGAAAAVIVPAIGTTVFFDAGALWFTTAAFIYASGLYTLAGATRSLRTRIRRLRVDLVRCAGEVRYTGDVSALQSAADSLDAMDYKITTGEVTPAEHERVWAQVYAALSERFLTVEQRR
jgi:hypothetical protein